MDIVKKLYKAARPFGPCGMFRGTESFRELMELFLSPQGIEFCMENDFPPAGYLQAVREAGASEMGIHIDEGKGTARNARIIALVGDTDFELFYDTLEYACKVVLMKGARCTIHASGYSVVSVSAQPGCEVFKDISDRAIVKGI